MLSTLGFLASECLILPHTPPLPLISTNICIYSTYICATNVCVFHMRHKYPCTYVYRCESVRKAVERVFGILKKRFRVLKLPLMGGDVEEIEDMLFSCFIMHNMLLRDKNRMDLGHMEGDWIDRPPAAHRARRALYTSVNGRTLLFNFRAFTVLDNTDFSLLGSQASHPNFCRATDTVVLTETDSAFARRRNVLAAHHEIVSGPRFAGAACEQPRWLLPASESRPCD